MSVATVTAAASGSPRIVRTAGSALPSRPAPAVRDRRRDEHEPVDPFRHPRREAGARQCAERVPDEAGAPDVEPLHQLAEDVGGLRQAEGRAPAERQAEAEAGKLGQDDAMSFGERLRRAAPPAGGAAEAVHQQDGWAVADGAEAHDTAADPHPRVVDSWTQVDGVSIHSQILGTGRAGN